MKKKVLITGAKSYVGTNVETWLMKEPDKFYVETLDMKDPNWKDFDFSKFDVVFHVAGIAHVSSKKNMDSLYYKVNRDLAVEAAKHSRKNGINQFIFMSSMIIYGKENSFGNKEHIDIKKYDPTNAYGKSKLEADLKIQELSNDNFQVSIIRTPVIFGPNCKGNFPRLQSLSKKLLIIPNLNNQRSMIYIDNFSEFVKRLIEKKAHGVFYPQNSEFLSTSQILMQTRSALGKKTLSTKMFNPIIILLTKCSSFFRKIYGNKTYDLRQSNITFNDYNIVGNKESIIKSINK